MFQERVFGSSEFFFSRVIGSTTSATLKFHLLLNNNIMMALSDNDSELSDAPTTLTTPFTIAAGSVASSKPAQHTRGVKDRRPIVPKNPPKPSQKQTPALDNDAPLAEIPVRILEKETEEASSSDDLRLEDSAFKVPLQTPGPGSSVSQASSSSLKRPRGKTSAIHEYVTQQGDLLICKKCSKTYKLSGGTGAITRHLADKHFINPRASRISEKRIREGTAIDAANSVGLRAMSKSKKGEGSNLWLSALIRLLWSTCIYTGQFKKTFLLIW